MHSDMNRVNSDVKWEVDVKSYGGIYQFKQGFAYNHTLVLPLCMYVLRFWWFSQASVLSGSYG